MHCTKCQAPRRTDSTAGLRGAQADVDSLKGQILVKLGKTDDADRLLENASNVFQQFARTTSADDRRTLANVYLLLGITQVVQGTAQLARNNSASAKTDLQAAVQTFNACTK